MCEIAPLSFTIASKLKYMSNIFDSVLLKTFFLVEANFTQPPHCRSGFKPQSFDDLQLNIFSVIIIFLKRLYYHPRKHRSIIREKQYAQSIVFSVIRFSCWPAEFSNGTEFVQSPDLRVRISSSFPQPRTPHPLMRYDITESGPSASITVWNKFDKIPIIITSIK